ncbi:MAG TPA: hypothetical protein VJQ83_08320 [Tepidiformaceae bacterium]|nr:hypothetical protein [Tepidiformaceae bacterium]
MNYAGMMMVAAGQSDGNATLVGALGGDAHVTEFLDFRGSAVTSGSTITSAHDIRGSTGFGPSLAATGSPTLANNRAVFAAGQDLHTSTLALFTLTSPGSLLLGAIDRGGANIAGVAPSAAAASIINPSDNGTDISLWTDHNTVTTVAVSSAVVPIVITWDGVSGATIQIPNQGVVTATGSANFTSGNCALTLGGFFTANGDNGAVEIACALTADHEVNASEVGAFRDYVVAQHAGVAQ